MQDRVAFRLQTSVPVLVEMVFAGVQFRVCFGAPVQIPGGLPGLMLCRRFDPQVWKLKPRGFVSPWVQRG